VTAAAHDTVERALVAAVLAQPSLIDELEAVVSERDFSQRAARLVYRAARALRDRGDTPDVLTIAAFLESRRQLAAAEGFLRDLVATPEDVRLARGIARDGAALEGEWRRWMVAEAEHHRVNGTRERADVVLDGEGNVVLGPEPA